MSKHLKVSPPPSPAPVAHLRNVLQVDWPERLKHIVRDPDLLDRYGSSDLKRIGKMLIGTINSLGQRAARAEIAHSQAEQALAEAPKADDATLAKDLDRVTARCLVLTGGRPPAWSYLYKEACQVLHEYREFEVKRGSKGWQVLGVDAAGKRWNLYDFDYAGLGVTVAASEARLMAAHLRQTFTPRNPTPEE